MINGASLPSRLAQSRICSRLTAVLGSAAVDKLVAKCVQALEQHAEQRWRIAAGQSLLGGALTAGEAGFPGGPADLAALVIQEALEHVRIIQQHGDAAGELLPHQCVDTLTLVQRAELFQKSLEGLLLREALALVTLCGIGRIEGDPQEDEATVEIVRLLGAVEPTQSAAHPQAQIGLLGIALLAMVLLERSNSSPHHSIKRNCKRNFSGLKALLRAGRSLDIV